jgi:hypothetical protein
MNKRYFKNSHKWTEDDANTVGLPRPFANPKRKDLAKTVPIPWQSKDDFDKHNKLDLNLKNEYDSYLKGLCPYCGIKIKKEEIVTRWTTAKLENITYDEALVYSDIHPFHIECMKEGRIFCPFMRKLKDLDFEINTYLNLRKNFLTDKKISEKRKVEKFFKAI